MKLIECELVQILISETDPAQIIVLQELGAPKRRLSIEIGFVEAMSIKGAVHGFEYTRPITHDLIHNILKQLNAPVKYIIISEIKAYEEGAIFFGQLVLEQDNKELKLDCRPSDAIALAVRCDCPIYIVDDILNIAAD